VVFDRARAGDVLSGVRYFGRLTMPTEPSATSRSDALSAPYVRRAPKVRAGVATARRRKRAWRSMGLVLPSRKLGPISCGSRWERAGAGRRRI